jgi:alpha-tubulin suppressor-like RCC1 family protein
MLGFGEKTKKQQKKEAADMAKIRKRKLKKKMFLKKLKKKALMDMIWDDRENRIWERRENEPRIEESGWERERILRGIKCGTMADKHLKTHKPKVIPPPRRMGLDDEEGGDGETLKDGTVLAKASNSLSTFMPLYSEALRQYRVTKVSTGFQHTLVCTDQGVCLSFGRGKDGQLGHNHYKNVMTPTVIEALRDVFVIDVAAGLAHSCIISRPHDRYIFCMGKNDIGQLGVGYCRPSRICKPTLVVNSVDIAPLCVSAGYLHTAVLSENGTVWTWGDNTYGQLGHGLVPDLNKVSTVRNADSKMEPKIILSLQQVLVSHLALGAYHTAVITETGDIFTCGRGDMGQLGLGSYKDSASMTIVDELSEIEVTDVSCGAEHTIVCTADGKVYGFGSNRYSQIGMVRPGENGALLQIASRPNTSSTRKSSRKGKRKKRSNSPVSPKSPKNSRDKSDKYNVPQLINTGNFTESKHVWRVAAGGKHSIFITKRGKMYGVGESGYNGRMGHMTAERQYVPTVVKYLKKRLKKTDKVWQGNFKDTFKAMATEEPELDRNYTAVYDLGDDPAFKVKGNKIPKEFIDNFNELRAECLFESRMIEVRRMWNKEDRANRGRMNALGFGKALKLAHIWASDWTLDKIAVTIGGNTTSEVEVEDFMQYIGENLRKSLLAEHFFHRMYVRFFCKKKQFLIDEEAGEIFIELLTEKFKEEGLTDFEYILKHIRDDDPKEENPKTGKKKGFAHNQFWQAGKINLYKMGLTDVHVHALCEALKEFPCIMNIDLRRNYLSYRSANYIMDAARYQLKRVTETDYYQKIKEGRPQSSLHCQCVNCHEEVIFRKRDADVATCMICGQRAYRPIYLLQNIKIREVFLSAEDELKWRTVDCDVDLTDKLITTLKSHNPMSVSKFKNLCRSTCRYHLKTWEKELDEIFEKAHKRKSDKSKLKIALRQEHEKRKKRLFKSIRVFIEDKTRKHYLKLYRMQASYELQILMKSSIVQTGEKMGKAFLPIFPTTTEVILEMMQNLHHENKEIIRKTKWHVPKLMQILYDLVFKSARDLYRHYATLNLDYIPGAISAGETYTTVAMQSGRVMTFGNQDDIQAGFRDEIMNNLPKKFRRLIEKQREKNIRAQTRELARRRSTMFQPVEGFTLPKRDSALHGLDLKEYKRQVKLRENGTNEIEEEEEGPQSPVRHSPRKKRLNTQADHDIPPFLELNECHFHGDGHRNAGSTHARDVVHDSEGLIALHTTLSTTDHHPNSDGSSNESHDAYSSDSSYSSYTSSGSGSSYSSGSGSGSESDSYSNGSRKEEDDETFSQTTTSTYISSSKRRDN